MWNENSVTEFWQEYNSDYSGDIKASEIIRLSRKYIKGKVLDIGAGSGALIKLLPSAVGLDIAPKNPRIVEGNIAKLPFADKLFNTLFVTDIIEHLDIGTLNRGFIEMNRVLVDGGYVIAVVPYKEDLKQSIVGCPSCNVKFHRWGHLQSYDDNVISELFKRYGFTVVSLKILPLSLMAEHWLIRYFWKIFVAVGFVKVNDMFVVARKQ